MGYFEPVMPVQMNVRGMTRGKCEQTIQEALENVSGPDQRGNCWNHPKIYAGTE